MSFLLAAIMGILLLASCTTKPDRQSLNIAAAASLTPVLEDIIYVYAQETGVRIIPSFAATGQLAQQIRNGAPFDIFTAADSLHIDQLIESGYLISETRMAYARGELVLVQSVESSWPMDSLDSLRNPGIERIAIANPEHAPYGIAAKDSLVSLGLWEVLEDKILYAETVQQAAVIVETGNADAGLIARSVQTPLLTIVQEVPISSYAPITHFAAVLTTSRQPDVAQAFLRFLSTPEAVSIFETYGLKPP